MILNVYELNSSKKRKFFSDWIKMKSNHVIYRKQTHLQYKNTKGLNKNSENDILCQ